MKIQKWFLDQLPIADKEVIENALLSNTFQKARKTLKAQEIAFFNLGKRVKIWIPKSCLDEDQEFNISRPKKTTLNAIEQRIGLVDLLKSNNIKADMTMETPDLRMLLRIGEIEIPRDLGGNV